MSEPARRRLVNWYAFAAAATTVAVIPLFVTSFYWQQLIIVVALNVTLALGLNLILGYTGQLALGHIAFYGIGAYTSAIMVMRLGLSFWIAIVVATIFAGVAGWILSLFTLRLRGHYLAIATIGFHVITYQILLNWISVTRGPQGIPGIPPPDPISIGIATVNFSDQQSYFYLVALFAFAMYLLLKALLRSPVGDALLAVREDEISAQSIGINPFRWKMFAFVLGSALAGTAGSLYAHYLRILAPESFFVVESFTLLAMVVVGGMGTMGGPVVGAIVLTLAPQLARAIGPYRLVIFGAALTAVVLFFPSGLAGIGRRLVGARVREPRLEAETESEREQVGAA